MSSRKIRKSTLVVLTVAGSVVVALPALIAPAVAQTTKAADSPTLNKSKTTKGVENPTTKAVPGPVSAKSVDGGITKPNPKAGDWDMKNPKTTKGVENPTTAQNLKQAPSDPSKAKNAQNLKQAPSDPSKAKNVKGVDGGITKYK